MRCIAGVLPTSCQDLQAVDELLLDGFFRFRVISPVDGSTVGEVTLYCVMSITPAKSFLPLPAGRATNYATTDWRFAYNPKICDSSFRTYDRYGRTEFDMINVIPATHGKVGISYHLGNKSTRCYTGVSCEIFMVMKSMLKTRKQSQTVKPFRSINSFICNSHSLPSADFFWKIRNRKVLFDNAYLTANMTKTFIIAVFLIINQITKFLTTKLIYLQYFKRLYIKYLRILLWWSNLNSQNHTGNH